MVILLVMIIAIIAVPTVAEAIAHPEENLLRSTGQAIEETVVKPIEETVSRSLKRYFDNWSLKLYFDKMIAEVEDYALKTLLRSVFSWFTKIFKMIRSMFKF